jgi:hypothetical protein
MKKTIEEWKKSGELGEFSYLRASMPPGNWMFGIEDPIFANDSDQSPAQEQESVPSWMDKGTGEKYVDFVNYYIHQLNLIRYLLKEDYSVKYAESSGRLLVGETDSGKPVVLEMNTYNLKNEWHEFYTAFFEKGYIKLSLPAPLARQHSGKVEIYINNNSGEYYKNPVFSPRWCMSEQARIFVETIQKKRDCISPAEDGLKDLEVAESYIKLLTKK